VTAGLKPSGRPDVALVVNDGPVIVAAAVYTANRCKANPVLWSERASADGRVRAVVLNSGGANCFTGAAGFQLTHATAEQVAAGLTASGQETGAVDVVVCSTGLIGEPLDHPRLRAGVAEALASLAPDGGPGAARAIMTTDTRAKQTVQEAGDGWVVGGMAKGAGMLAPGLATMLAVLTTDAHVDAAGCDAALRRAVSVTFDRLDTDGCMSTNDTVVLLASGASGVAPSPQAFDAVVEAACRDLTEQLLSDAEGADHEITIEVRGAATETEAVAVARAVARSALVKAAVFGRDPNWGRILAAVGTTDARFEPSRIDVEINGVRVCHQGGPDRPRSDVDLSGPAVSVTIDLQAGAARGHVWTTDLTHAYVHENSAYST
jgi:glutamate N-acetyltransferase/amino-acid N-acetyltransferase